MVDPTGKRLREETEFKGPPSKKIDNKLDSKTPIALSSLARFDPISSHLEKDSASGQLTVKSPGSGEHYGWKYNEWRLNPLGSNFLPNKEEITKKQTDLLDLSESFLSFEGKNLKNEEELADLILFGENVIKHIKTAKINSVLPFLLSPEIKKYNESLDNLSINVDERIKALKQDLSCLKTLKQQHLSSYNELCQVLPRVDVDAIFKACSDRQRGHIAFEELKSILKGIHFEKEAFSKIFCACLSKAPAYDWGPLLPPRNLEVSKDVRDYYMLEQKLKRCFPTDGAYLNSIEAQTGRPFEHTLLTAEEFNQLCDNLMNTAVRIGDAVCADLQYWSENGGHDNATKFDLLIKQGGFSGKGNGTYLYKAYFCLPKVYFRLATLNLSQHPPERFMRTEYNNPNVSLMPKDWDKQFFQPGKKPFEWRKSYHRFRDKILELTDGVLERPNETRFKNLAPEHTSEDIRPIGLAPS